MMRLAVVGDLSQNDPAKLAKVLDAALAASDLVVQVGDINPGYDVVRARLTSGKLLCIPGNHDTQGPGAWPADFPAKQWQKTVSGVRLIGIDNTKDIIDEEGWALLRDYTVPALPLMLFCHKPLSPIVLPDGTESTHIMGEGSFPCADAEKLKSFLAPFNPALFHGHYHGAAVMKTSYGDVIVEGRGGASDVLGYTLLLIQPVGWTAHQVVL